MARQRYDGAGLRLKRTTTAGGTTTTALSIRAGLNIVSEYVDGALSAENVYANGQLIATVSGSSVQYFHRDHLSTRVITDETGATREQRGHYPYGELWYSTGPGASQTYIFTTYERDEATDQDYAIVRVFEPWQGRFTSPDPVGGNIESPRTLNRYVYAANDPVNNVDPTGELCLGWHKRTDHYVRTPRGYIYIGSDHSFLPVRCFSDAPGGATHDTGSGDAAVRQWFESDNVLCSFRAFYERSLADREHQWESTAWVVPSGAEFRLDPSGWSNDKRGFSTLDPRVPRPYGYVAIVHTHPRTGNWVQQPSLTGGPTGQGDWGVAKQLVVPNFTLTSSGIWVVTPDELQNLTNPRKVLPWSDVPSAKECK